MDPETQAETRIGTTLCNKWTLDKLLGVGGMAAVYVATHKIGRKEAIKILHPEVARSPELRARFEQEAHVANRFRHPGAVEIRDIDQSEDGTPFLVMELLHGEPLSDRAKRLGGIELPELYRLIDELLDVLAAAHAEGIVHRDIKLDNLFIQTDGHLKVLDFGIARLANSLPKPLRTRVGTALGTTPYMPPEQIKGLAVDARADLFAVGATIFRLVAKRRLHEAANEADLAVKMASMPAPPLCSVAKDAPPALGLVVDRALMFRREERYPDALTMQADLRALRAGEPPPYATRMLGQPAPPDEPPPEAVPWTTGEVGPLLERTAAASPGALDRTAPAVAQGAATPASAMAVTARPGGAAPAAAMPATVPERKAAAERAPASPVGVEASLPMPAVAPISADRPDLPRDPATARAVPAPPSTVPDRLSAPEPSTTRTGPEPPPITGHEPTLKSPNALAPVVMPAPVPIDVVTPARAAPAAFPATAGSSVTRTLPAGELARPALPFARPVPIRRSRRLELALVAIVFLVLGVVLTLVLVRTLRRHPPGSAGDAPGEAPTAIGAEEPDGGSWGEPMRPKPAPQPAPVSPAGPGAPAGHGKGKGKNK
ncbi:MAG: protein kinase [Byssovorax sp.]